MTDGETLDRIIELARRADEDPAKWLTRESYLDAIAWVLERRDNNKKGQQ